MTVNLIDSSVSDSLLNSLHALFHSGFLEITWNQYNYYQFSDEENQACNDNVIYLNW